MEIEENIREILKTTFTKTEIPEDISKLSMGDFEEWDSLGNFNLILRLENYYGIQFDMGELESLNSVKAIREGILNALREERN